MFPFSIFVEACFSLYLTTLSVGKQSSNYSNFQHFEESAAKFYDREGPAMAVDTSSFHYFGFLFCFSLVAGNVFLIEKAKSFE
jgi:hypothetical protein